MSVRLALIVAAMLAILPGCLSRGGPPPPAPRLGLPAPDDMAHRPLPLFAKHKGPLLASAPDAPPYLLDSGDRLRIAVFGQDNLSRTYAVDGGGFVSLPLIGAVRARGITTYELERRVADQLRSRYVKDPKVTVEVETYRPFFILGEVQRPGQYPYVNDMTVQTAVAIAGGYTERAKESAVRVTRRVDGHAVKRTVPDNYIVRPGDTIYVMERFF